MHLDIADEAGTEALAARLAPVLQRGDVLLLTGTLGMGKTAFARALIRAACGPATEVPSPTFTLVQVYEAADGRAFWHFDLYRLPAPAPDEVEELGWAEARASAAALVEWPDRLGPLSPREALQVDIAPGAAGGDSRSIALVWQDGDWAQRLQAGGVDAG